MAEKLEILPTELTAGETLSVDVVLDGKTPADGWSLKYTFANSGGSIEVNATELDDDSGWNIALTSSQTVVFESGPLFFSGLAIKETEAVAVDSGEIAVLSLTSKWTVVLASVEAAIATWGTSDQRSMTIEGMSVSFRSIDELLTLRAFCIRQIDRQRRRAGRRVILSTFNMGQT